MSNFTIHEVTTTVNGKVVKQDSWTTCNECGSKLNSAGEWSRHRRMHTKIDQHTLNCHIPQHVLEANFPRANPAALALFDEATKTCTMNCGPHGADPRSAKERKFLCDDCVVTK